MNKFTDVIDVARMFSRSKKFNDLDTRVILPKMLVLFNEMRPEDHKLRGLPTSIKEWELRTTILYEFMTLMVEHEIPDIPQYLDDEETLKALEKTYTACADDGVVDLERLSLYFRWGPDESSPPPMSFKEKIVSKFKAMA